jgi:hypothetical protein
MSALNDQVRKHFLPSLMPVAIVEDSIILNGPTNTQVAAYPIRGSAIRIVRATANSSLILKEGDGGTSQPWTFVLNDAANAVVVFPAVGENLNGIGNNGFSIPAGQTGQFMRVDRTDPTFGQDWRATLIS